MLFIYFKTSFINEPSDIRFYRTKKKKKEWQKLNHFSVGQIELERMRNIKYIKKIKIHKLKPLISLNKRNPNHCYKSKYINC